MEPREAARRRYGAWGKGGYVLAKGEVDPAGRPGEMEAQPVKLMQRLLASASPPR